MQMTKKKSRENGRLTINVGEILKNRSNLRISKRAAIETREFTEDIFIPLLCDLAGKCAIEEGVKTIEERHYLRAKDWIISSFSASGII